MIKCPDIIDLESALGLPEDDPIRQHVQQCGQCQALLQSLVAFDHDGPLPGDEDVPGLQPENMVQAEGQLADFLSRQINSVQPVSVVSFPRTRSRKGLQPWMGIAAALVAVIGLWAVTPTLHEMGESKPVLRGSEVLQTNKLEVVSMSWDKDGSLVLVWQVFAEADSYVVVFWNDELKEYSRLEPVKKTTITISPKLLPPVEKAGYYSILAIKGKKEITRSSLLEIPGN